MPAGVSSEHQARELVADGQARALLLSLQLLSPSPSPWPSDDHGEGANKRREC